MAFSASKSRKRRDQRPVGRGRPINPSAAIREWYAGEINSICKLMIEEYRAQIKEALKSGPVAKFFATDAAATNKLTSSLSKLEKRWARIFNAFAEKTAAEFIKKVDEGATTATLMSLKTAGIDQPRAAYTSNVANTLQAAQEFNHTLITNIQKETHEKVFNAVMLSLTSPNPEEQGQSGIENALKEIGSFSKNKVKLIARDQTSKLYSSLSDERMAENGVEEFEWAHSSAGKEPRHSHQKMDGHIFKLNDPRLWQIGGEFDLKKGDLGPPGWAINCRCRKIPVI
jgi:SPP1 gp7 family putative phage head morphogenesis protein